jgi:hypothetical protein
MFQFGLGALQPVALRLWQSLSGAVDIEGQHREGGAIGAVLRRELLSAERLSDAAIRLGSLSVKTPRFRSSASLSRVTRCDQRFGAVFFGGDFVRAELALRAVVLRALLRLVLRADVFRERAVFCR